MPKPETPQLSLPANNYVFEIQVALLRNDGRPTTGRIDLSKRGCFIWESKQGSFKPGPDDELPFRKGTVTRETPGWDKAMMSAFQQAVGYAQGLKAQENWWPPFIIVGDIGHVMEIYSDFHGTGLYTPFPSAREYRLYIQDLVNPEIRELLRTIWTDPLSLDPAREKEKVTHAIGRQLGDLAASLEKSGHSQDEIAMFLMRCIFCFYAEDCGLLPHETFTQILANALTYPETFAANTLDLWVAMQTGGRSHVAGAELLHFGGVLFEDVTALAINQEQLAMLHEAALANWSAVDTSIFGLMLEQALSPEERAKLGAHYTPPAYVERLVIPAIIQPLRAKWEDVKVAALENITEGNYGSAIMEVENFLVYLSQVQILDPSCGSGNFLVVAMALMKDLEGEVLAALRDLGVNQRYIERFGHSVLPMQFSGIEIMPTAAAVAELVLWINYFQYHYKLYGNINPPQPILHNARLVECRDAVLAWDDIIDEVYINPRPADPWPVADFIVGNPPFIGSAKMRRALSEKYTEALRQAYPEVAGASDYVMYWWYRAALLAQAGQVERFGFITTNSITQRQNRLLTESFINGENPLYFTFAIPDHPWTDSISAAKVRIAMTVCAAGTGMGQLHTNIFERKQNEGFSQVYFDKREGYINSNLTIGADVGQAAKLKANQNIAYKGIETNGQGFVITFAEAQQLGLGMVPGLENHIRPFRIGRDLMQANRDVYVLDFYGLTAEEVERRFPAAFHWLLENVKPERELKSTKSLREKWWLFGQNSIEFRRNMETKERFIATAYTSKFKVFSFLDAEILPSSSVIAFTCDDAYVLGILSSYTHQVWAAATGGMFRDTLRYNHPLCFETFPFPAATEQQTINIRELAERIDQHRKHRQALYPELTLTQMYNVMDDMRYGVYLNDAKLDILEKGDLNLLYHLHKELDSVVLEAYGLPQDIKPADIVEKLLELNQQRVQEESAGQVRPVVSPRADLLSFRCIFSYEVNDGGQVKLAG